MSLLYGDFDSYEETDFSRGSTDTDYGPTKNAFMITITSEMLKEEENEVIAKKFEDWRMKRQSSLPASLRIRPLELTLGDYHDSLDFDRKVSLDR